MPHTTRRTLARLITLCAALLIGVAHAQPTEQALPDPPEPTREFRAAWIATVANIDWPSKKGLPTADAKAELVAILDRCVELNLNAVVFQIRPAGDAMYASELEPWSEWLTGETGKAPSPLWDPLAFAIDHAHDRGLDLHVWFNPYRAKHPTSQTEPVAPALAATQPDAVPTYGKHRWMDPGNPVVQQHSLDVIFDVVSRYDIDGIHLDDYFYPYPIRDDDGNEVPFPDEASYKAYQDRGGRLSRDDWRRKSVNDFVEEMYAGVKSIKPHVLVGISPFGIYRPGHPHFIRGFDQYDKLYADPLLWFQQGWLDYLTPQLYWPIAKPDQSFTALLQWWVEHNPAQRHVWPGLAPYRHFESPDRYPIEEFVHQVRWSRYLTDVTDGHIHFSMKWLMPGASANGQDREPLADRLKSAVYAEPVLPPATPWAAPDGDAPDAPRPGPIRAMNDGVSVTIESASLGDANRWIAQVYRNGAWHTQTGLATQPRLTVPTPGGGKVERVVLRSVDRFGRLSQPATLNP